MKPHRYRRAFPTLHQSARVRIIAFSTENFSPEELLALLGSSPPSKNFLLWDPSRKLTPLQIREIASARNISIDLRQNSDPALP